MFVPGELLVDKKVPSADYTNDLGPICVGCGTQEALNAIPQVPSLRCLVHMNLAVNV